MEDVSVTTIDCNRSTTQTILKIRSNKRTRRTWTCSQTIIMSHSSSHYSNYMDKSSIYPIARSTMISTWRKNCIPYSCLLLKTCPKKLIGSTNINVINHILISLDEMDDHIKSRFNPCIFLGEYLMRNN